MRKLRSCTLAHTTVPFHFNGLFVNHQDIVKLLCLSLQHNFLSIAIINFSRHHSRTTWTAKPYQHLPPTFDRWSVGSMGGCSTGSWWVSISESSFAGSDSRLASNEKGHPIPGPHVQSWFGMFQVQVQSRAWARDHLEGCAISHLIALSSAGRSHEEVVQQAQEFKDASTRYAEVEAELEKQKKENGLPYFDIVRMVTTDPMHTFLLGMVKCEPWAFEFSAEGRICTTITSLEC